MREVTQQGVDLVKRFEGFSATPYVCPAGYLTIGYGHLIRDDEKLIFDGGISKKDAEELLRQDLRASEQSVIRLIHTPLNDGQFDALVSFTFNLGAGALQRSTLRRKINRGEHELVPRELKRWVWANQKKLYGLVRRRQYESFLYQGNVHRLSF